MTFGKIIFKPTVSESEVSCTPAHIKLITYLFFFFPFISSQPVYSRVQLVLTGSADLITYIDASVFSLPHGFTLWSVGFYRSSTHLAVNMAGSTPNADVCLYGACFLCDIKTSYLMIAFCVL